VRQPAEFGSLNAWPRGAAPNDDGTISFITVDPGIIGLDFVVGTTEGRRTLTTRDGQHSYVFTEAGGAAPNAP
jgi:hypothetical protein